MDVTLPHPSHYYFQDPNVLTEDILLKSVSGQEIIAFGVYPDTSPSLGILVHRTNDAEELWASVPPRQRWQVPYPGLLDSSAGSMKYGHPQQDTQITDPITPSKLQEYSPSTWTEPSGPNIPSDWPGDAKTKPPRMTPRRRMISTAAVLLAAEKRRVNPHKFFCEYCSRGFTAKHNYQRHVAAHNDRRAFHCHCGSSFITKSDLKRHQERTKAHLTSIRDSFDLSNPALHIGNRYPTRCHDVVVQ